EVYGRDRVRELVLAFARNESTLPIRSQIGDDTPWTSGEATLPTRPVLWTAVPRNTTTARDNRNREGEDAEGGGQPLPQPAPRPVSPAVQPPVESLRPEPTPT